MALRWGQLPPLGCPASSQSSPLCCNVCLEPVSLLKPPAARWGESGSSEGGVGAVQEGGASYARAQPVTGCAWDQCRCWHWVQATRDPATWNSPEHFLLLANPPA